MEENTPDVVIKKANESQGYLVIQDEDIVYDLFRNLSFYVPGYMFMPSFKSGAFDGMCHMYDPATGCFPLGLSRYIYEFCESRKIKCKADSEVQDSFYDKSSNTIEIASFINSKKFFSKGCKLTPREDQIEATTRAIQLKRCLNICPTSFGKSLSITMECLWFLEKGYKCLIIVPTKSLVNQFENDINDYATNEDGVKESWMPVIQTIYASKEKKIADDTQICISTWQSLASIYKFGNREYMNQFDVIIMDEVHGSHAQVCQKLMLSANEVKYRTGWTGTLSDDIINKLLVIGLFGPEKSIITTRELMDKNIVAQLSILITKLKYPNELAKQYVKLSYQEQMSYLYNSNFRNNYLLALIGTLPKTGLAFYKVIKHGTTLFELARKKYPDRNIYLVHSGHFQKNDEMFKSFEELKVEIEKDSSGIVFANYQLASTGISIKNLHWLMFFVPIKSFITTMQSIGRGLRVSKNKNKVVLIDIVDDFVCKERGKLYTNYASLQFFDRFKMYNQSQFDYKQCQIEVNPPKEEFDVKQVIGKKDKNFEELELF